ncbi:hypothetical protein SCHPADRAFT_846749 [Schizopora paradoxa]|uniref:Uncharacterized protein n=1 Tax=Schizopora paradoxa TaxID=27342 RepID=A0A0H2S6H2_9AGAM|nr:hypothetical protein SCHPADRAFT_846749 [Schizopora paradoxa]
MTNDNGDLNSPRNSDPNSSSKGDKTLKAPSDDVGPGVDTSSRPVPKLGEQENVGDHSQTMRRIFIGPMPRKRVVDETGDLDDSRYNDVLEHFVESHGHNLFIKMGGREEDWGDDAARAIRERLLERINDSLWLHAKKTGRAKRGMVTQNTEWVGSSFEVGEILGVSMLAGKQGFDTTKVDDGAENPQAGPSSESAGAGTPRPPTSVGAQSSYITAPEGPSLRPSPSVINGQSSGESERSSKGILSLPEGRRRVTSQSGRSGPSNLKNMASVRSIVTTRSKKKDKGKARVRYEDEERPVHAPPPTGAKDPAPPGEVLARAPTEVMDSSAAAVEVAAQAKVGLDDEEASSSDIIMRDRMLVRVIHSNNHDFEKPFNDKMCRSTRHLEFQKWSECIVIWRKNRIEIYQDYRSLCKERFLGHKRLSFVIPLSSKDTTLSLYSLVDFSFCLVSPSRPVKTTGWLRRQWTLLRGDRGMDLFILRSQSRSRSVDWYWRLWSELGGTLPESLDVSIPLINVRVKVFLPTNGDRRPLTRDRVITLCEKSTDNVDGLANLREEQVVQKNRKLELCWRTETKLDWVWLDNDVEGNQRDNAVCYGIALQDTHVPATLELRAAEHYSTYIKQGESVRLAEPPAIEGYVYIVKPVPQSRSLVYLSTNDGWLFSTRSTHAVPPPTTTSVAVFMSNGPAQFRKEEMNRQRVLIIRSRGFWDLRTVVMVRRAFQLVPETKDGNVQPQLDGEGHWYLNRAAEEAPEWPEIERMDSDDVDVPGDDALNSSQDKPRLRMHRAFELVFKSGHVMRFEAHSRKLALEWITRLRELITYWTLRHRADARLEMSILKESYGIDKITPGKLEKVASLPPDPTHGSHHLPTFWNWCVLDACRSVLKSGRLFTKSKLEGQYVHSQLFLVEGQVVQFTLSFEGTMHHQRGKVISLLDAYVCSGFYAARELPLYDYDPNATSNARIYADGLEAKNADEDIIFMIWYRKQTVLARNNYNTIPVKRMSSKPKMLICRARSRLERDAWCWALNSEMERVTRAARKREEQIREQASPMV